MTHEKAPCGAKALCEIVYVDSYTVPASRSFAVVRDHDLLLALHALQAALSNGIVELSKALGST